jgi:hypothetical protein
MQAEPLPGDIVGSVNLPLSPGKANRQSRRSTRARPGAGAGRRRYRRWSQVSRSDRGGARLGCAGSTATDSPPRYLRIRSMTAGVSMLAMTRSRPPQCRQVSISMANTRLRRCAQVRPRWRLEADADPCWLASLAGAVRVAGTTRARSGLAGANTPWYLVRWGCRGVWHCQG